MSTEKTTEVVGCDASIMKNVWEIREREYEQKQQQEQDRIDKSALTSINKDWQNRLNAKLGKAVRVERKVKRVEIDTDTSNVWQTKRPEVPPTLPRGMGAGPLGRTGDQRRGFSTSASNYKDKKGQDKNLLKLQLLMSISQNQPSVMVWGKSWKYNKSLPPPEEDPAAAPNWGKCWMLATKQPYSEPGKPWLNGPNLMDPHSLHLWKKPAYRMVESQELDLCLPSEEWNMSWRKSDEKNKKEDASSASGENSPKSGFFTLLVQTQHHYEALSSSEWSESWKSTKPANQQDNCTIPNDGLMNKSIAHKQQEKEMSSEWEGCWMLANHYGCNKSKLPQVQKSSPEWAESWRAAMVVFNNHKNSDPSSRQGHSQQNESHYHKVILVSHEQKHKDLYLQPSNEFKALSEWSKSWQVTKNNSKPCEEIEKVLKFKPARMETASEAQMERNAKVHYSTSEKTDPCYEQLKNNVIYHPRNEFTQKKRLHLEHVKNVLSATEWRDSWKTLKHRMRMERRRMRPDPFRPLGGSQRGADMKHTASEWKDSWKFNCQPLRQDPQAWQQGWTTTPQIRVNRARDQNHFPTVELPKNGPTGERNWGESWMLSRPRHQSEPGQGRAQTMRERSNVASHHPDESWSHRRAGHTGHSRSVCDWQEAWMFSETQFHHDRPSLTQWRHAWKWSAFNTGHWPEQVFRGNGMDVLMEIQHQREEISLQRARAKISRSFDTKMFRERYPEKQWSTSWSAGSLLSHQPSYYKSSGIPGKSISSGNQQHYTSQNGHGSKWGMSFRLANPMPHVEQPWVESSPNPNRYVVMWSREKNNINTKNFSSNPTTSGLWGNSHQFLQGACAKTKSKTSKGPTDPRVIKTHNIQTRTHLYSDINKDNQSVRQWAGCHLLGKTQPRPKRGAAPGTKPKMEDENQDKFFEEWAESWRFLNRSGSLQGQMPVKSLSTWKESWKFLLPLSQPMNSPKTI